MDGGLTRYAYRFTCDMNIGLNAVLTLKDARIPLDALCQAVIVKHGRVQHLRQTPHLLERVMRNFTHFSQLCSQRRLWGQSFPFCACEHCAYCCQNLTEFV